MAARHTESSALPGSLLIDLVFYTGIQALGLLAPARPGGPVDRLNSCQDGECLLGWDQVGFVFHHPGAESLNAPLQRMQTPCRGSLFAGSYSPEANMRQGFICVIRRPPFTVNFD